MSRLQALRGRLDERLLVTNLVNIRYLTGFDSSNAALLVDPSGPTRLYTDFRYIEAAEAVPDVEAVQAKRSLLVDLAGRLRGRLAFEADVLPYAQFETLRGGDLELTPASGIVVAQRAVKDEDGSTGSVCRACRRSSLEALTAEAWIGQRAQLAWRLRQPSTRTAPTLLHRVATAAPERGKPHAEPGDAIVPRTHSSSPTGARRSRPLRLHAPLRRAPAEPAARRRVLEAQSRGRGEAPG